MMFSSISKKERNIVIDKCYWPLLELAKKYSIPIGIEATGCTLEIIENIDPTWIKELKNMLSNGYCEFIGSGYAQIITPLVPAKVNQKNLKIGNELYKSIIGYKPKIALLNEQAFSSGLIEIYLNEGYEAIIMEWNNPYRMHKEWKSEWRYFPQIAVDNYGNKIKVIWNQSIAFQKFQRYAHKEIELDEYFEYLNNFISNSERNISLYGSDAEVFDFRPYRQDKKITNEDNSEWDRIERLIESIQENHNFKWVAPSTVIKSNSKIAFNNLYLDSAAQPIPVKKQSKYNILRWAVTGRDDLDINTRCNRIYNILNYNQEKSENKWKELCYLWSSDFRTHIEDNRWKEFQERIRRFEAEISRDNRLLQERNSKNISKIKSSNENQIEWNLSERWLDVFYKDIHIKFDCRKGLTIDSYIKESISSKPIFGTIKHGDLDDIAWGSDFFSGHLIMETPGEKKTTDLIYVKPIIKLINNKLLITSNIETNLGPLEKEWSLNLDNMDLTLDVKIDWKNPKVGSLRLGHITLIPDSFDQNTLEVKTSNGGYSIETFKLQNEQVDLGKPVSFLVSGSNALGLTEGYISLEDKFKILSIEVDRCSASTVGLLTHQPVGPKWFTRLSLSARELDDTSKASSIKQNHRMTIKLIKK